MVHCIADIYVNQERKHNESVKDASIKYGGGVIEYSNNTDVI